MIIAVFVMEINMTAAVVVPLVILETVCEIMIFSRNKSNKSQKRDNLGDHDKHVHQKVIKSTQT